MAEEKNLDSEENKDRWSTHNRLIIVQEELLKHSRRMEVYKQHSQLIIYDVVFYIILG